MVIIVICMPLFCCTTCFSTIRSACCIAIWPFQFCCKILGICANFREYYANLPSAPTQNIRMSNLRDREAERLEQELFNPQQPNLPIIREPTIPFRYQSPSDPILELEQPTNHILDTANTARYKFDTAGNFNSLRILFQTPTNELLIYNFDTKCLDHANGLYSTPVKLPSLILTRFNIDKQKVRLSYHKPRDSDKTIVKEHPTYYYVHNDNGYITNGLNKIYGVPTPHTE